VADEIRSILTNPLVVAVGECGLDFDRDFSPRPLQLACCEEQIKYESSPDSPLSYVEKYVMIWTDGISKDFH
jgi:TatD DNase family protein